MFINIYILYLCHQSYVNVNIMKTQTEKILNVLRIIAWIGYVGSNVIFGLIIASVLLSFISPETKVNFSDLAMNQTELRKTYLASYLLILLCTLIWAFLNIQLWRNVKSILYKINLKKPFSMGIAIIIERIGFILIGIWIIEFSSDGYISYISKQIDGIKKDFNVSLFYLFNAGIVYIVSQIFKRGVELQEENELTV